MSYQERQTIAYLISSMLVVAGYAVYLFQRYQSGSLDSNTISSSWGRVILVLVGVQIVLSIVTSILITIIHAIRTWEAQPELSDERDHLIELKAERISYAVFGVGFLIAMGTLAASLAPLVMLNVIVLSLFGTWMVGSIAKLYYYRRGF